MTKELVSIGTAQFEEEAKKRQFLQQNVAYPYFAVGYMVGFTELIMGSASYLDSEVAVVGLGSVALSSALFEGFSKLNMGRVKSINEELNLRKGQLRFWDKKGAVRPVLEL